MPVVSRKLVLIGAVLFACSSGTSSVVGQTAGTGAGPMDPYGLAEVPPAIGRAKTASDAADLAQAAASWFNMFGVREVVRASLKEQNSRIRDTLTNTGQPGVLYRVDIQKTEGEIPFYSVVGKQIGFVGAGTSPIAVNSAANQRAHLRNAPSQGASIVTERSYFLWFTKQGRNIQTNALPAAPLINETAQRFADQKLLEGLNQSDHTRALGVAAEKLGQTTRSNLVKAKIADLRARQEETNKRVRDIEASLQAALEKARKAQAAAATLSLISTALTLGAQIAALKASLGSDAPPGLDSAKSSSELQQMANDLSNDAIARKEAIQLEYNSYIDQSRGVRVEFLQLLRETDYPVDAVPQLRSLE